MEDVIPQKRIGRNPYSEDLKIIDFKLYKIQNKINTYYVPVYILTDRVLGSIENYDPYETMIRIGFIDNCLFLDNCQERCCTKLEAYSQHKRIYKKLLKGFYDKEILEIVESEVSCKMNNCQ